MALFVSDANATLATVLPGEDPALAQRFAALLQAGNTLAVPGLWHLEVTNVLLNKVRRHKMALEEAQEVFAVLQGHRVRTDRFSAEPSVLKEIWHLAVTHQLTTYDATYLELAMRLGCGLLTNDDALCRAAPAEGVRVL
jgi:predicted nucleic acid-binding protein